MDSEEQLQQYIQEQIKRLEGKNFKHKNGQRYKVLFLTNTVTDAKRNIEHPIDVIYIGSNGNKWSRALSDWDRSFTIISE